MQFPIKNRRAWHCTLLVYIFFLFCFCKVFANNHTIAWTTKKYHKSVVVYCMTPWTEGGLTHADTCCDLQRIMRKLTVCVMG